MSSVSSVETTAQQNFNPSWMRTNSSSNRGGFISSGTNRLSGAGAGYDDGSDDSTANVAAAHAVLSSPVVSEYSYSRERLLELVPTGSIMPDALRDQLFFNENNLPLVSNTPLTDIEQKLQHNINSSKAMSLLSHSDRASIAAGAAYGSGYGGGLANGQSPTNRWTPKGAWSKTTPERSPLGSGSSARGGSTAGRAGGSFFAGRGGGRIGGDNGFGGLANGSSEESPSNPGIYQPKFSALRRGGGAIGVGRGGSTSGATFNTRADALYNPNDPTDRPKTVTAPAITRSESDDEEEGWSKVGATARHSSSTASAPSSAAVASERPAWARSESFIQRQQASQQQQAAAAAAAAAASQQPAAQAPVNQWNNREASGDSNVWSDRNQMVASVKKTSVDVSPVPQAAPAAAPATAPPADEEHEMSHLMMPNYAPNSSTWSNSVLGGGMGVFYQPPAPAPVVTEEVAPQPVEFYYMDPTETHRGPFSKVQMNAWFKAGYFTDEALRVQRGKDGEYKTVGDLKKLHGVTTPFDYPEDMEKPAPRVLPPPAIPTVPTSIPSMSSFPSAVNPLYPQPTFGMNTMFSMPTPDVYSMMQSNLEQQLALERKRLMEDHNRRLAEEAKKMQEFQEAIYRQMTLHQEASAQQLREKELALARHREELERRDVEMKQEALARQQKIEMEARELAERKAALEADDRRARLLEEHRLKQQEEEQREKAQREVAREAADRVRRAEEAAEKERIRLEQEARAAEEVIRQLRLRQEIEEREKVEEQKKKRLAEEREKLAREAAERQQQAELEAVWGKKPTVVNTTQAAAPGGGPKQVSPSGSDDSEGWTAANKKEVKHTKAAPWAAAVPVAPPAEKTLLEIQREEERQMKAEREQIAKQKAKEQAANLGSVAAEKEKASAISSWSGKTGWAAPEASSPQKSYVSPFLDGPSLETAHKQLQKKVSQPKLVPAKPAAPVASASKSKAVAPAATTQKKKTKQETESEQFEQWFVKRFRTFSSAIDCKTLFDCIMELENPNEVEDIVMSYLDESKTVKEFVREFIKRRIAMRAACGTGRPEVDDLTSARTAQAAPSDSNSGSNSNSGNGQGKKNKKTTKQVLDGNILGFRGAAASDRLNKGEIDAVPSAPVNPSRR